MRTTYEPLNAAFSNAAHLAAQQQVYPFIFNVPQKALTFEDTLLAQDERCRILDGEMAVDRIVHVSVLKLRAPLVFTIQERFRRPNFAHYQDITITEWNHASNLPSELYKMNAVLFVYGYYAEVSQKFIDAIAVDVPALFQAIAAGRIHYEKQQNKKQQDFLSFKFADLERSGVVYWHMAPSRSLREVKTTYAIV